MQKNQNRTFAEHRAICFNDTVKARVEEKWWGVFNRPISLRISYLLSKIDWITPNQITAINMVLPLAGFFLVISSCWGIIIYLLTFELWAILDCVDGELARATKKTSLYGPYLDSVGHYLSYIGLMVPLSLKSWLITGGEPWVLRLGLISVIFVMLASIAQQMQAVILYKEGVYKDVLSQKTSSWFLEVYRFLVGTLEIAFIGGILSFLTIYEHWIKYNWIIWMSFFSFYILLFLLSLIFHLVSAKKNLSS